MRIPSEIATVVKRLGDLRERVVFVGGMIRPLLITDPAVEAARPTLDVDLIVDEYDGGPATVYAGLTSSASAGRYVRRWIRDRYSYRRVR